MDPYLLRAAHPPCCIVVYDQSVPYRQAGDLLLEIAGSGVVSLMEYVLSKGYSTDFVSASGEAMTHPESSRLAPPPCLTLILTLTLALVPPAP